MKSAGDSSIYPANLSVPGHYWVDGVQVYLFTVTCIANCYRSVATTGRLKPVVFPVINKHMNFGLFCAYGTLIFAI